MGGWFTRPCSRFHFLSSGFFSNKNAIVPDISPSQRSQLEYSTLGNNLPATCDRLYMPFSIRIHFDSITIKLILWVCTPQSHSMPGCIGELQYNLRIVLTGSNPPIISIPGSTDPAKRILEFYPGQGRSGGCGSDNVLIGLASASPFPIAARSGLHSGDAWKSKKTSLAPAGKTLRSGSSSVYAPPVRWLSKSFSFCPIGRKH